MKWKLAASLELVAEATTEVVQKRVTLAGAAVLPVAGILLLEVITSEINPSLVAQVMLALVALPLYAVLAMIVHRVVLLGEHSLPNRWGLFSTERETRFLGWSIGILLLYFALTLPMGLIYMALFEDFAGWDLPWVATALSYIWVS